MKICRRSAQKRTRRTRGLAVSKDEAREHVYGMPQEEWKALYQREAGAEAKERFEAAGH